MYIKTLKQLKHIMQIKSRHVSLSLYNILIRKSLSFNCIVLEITVLLCVLSYKFRSSFHGSCADDVAYTCTRFRPLVVLLNILRSMSRNNDSRFKMCPIHLSLRFVVQERGRFYSRCICTLETRRISGRSCVQRSERRAVVI